MHYDHFKEWIKKEDMKVGALYECKARNFTIGKWDGDKFEYERTKFGMTFIDHEYHYDDGAPYGTVKPLKEIEQNNDQ